MLTWKHNLESPSKWNNSWLKANNQDNELSYLYWEICYIETIPTIYIKSMVLYIDVLTVVFMQVIKSTT